MSCCVVCLPGKCLGADCPFVDVLPHDQDSILKAQKIFEAFKMDYVKESLIKAKGIDAKKALVEDWLLQYETNEKMCELFRFQDLVKHYQDRFGPLEEKEDHAASVAVFPGLSKCTTVSLSKTEDDPDHDMVDRF
ncbi:hypothetical protein CTI12_AA021880 [Artemisia annua]|uniref:Uncharacterized protein n=1 Tax=Artemisia annua TaxID=35608 RepID=A0A2U1QIW9_ARTAN|nr:hypothetical protein CTI12_AA021880 [Artemisia annua]